MNTPEEIATLNARLAAFLARDEAKHAAALAAHKAAQKNEIDSETLAKISAQEDCRTLGRELRDANATIAALRADVEGSAKTVAALRAELDAAHARLDGVAEVLRKPICFPMDNVTSETLASILLRNSL